MYYIYMSTIIGLITVLLGVGSINLTNALFPSSGILIMFIVRIIIYFAFINLLMDFFKKTYNFLDFKIMKIDIKKRITIKIFIYLWTFTFYLYISYLNN